MEKLIYFLTVAIFQISSIRNIEREPVGGGDSLEIKKELYSQSKSKRTFIVHSLSYSICLKRR